MRSCIILATTMSMLGSAAVSAQSLQDAQSWTTRTGEARDGALIRWHFSSEEASPVIGILPGESILETDITALTGQVDFFLFGDEFYLSAGAVRPLDGIVTPGWAQQAASPAYVRFPHAELSEDLRQSGLERLTSYLGAGITVRDMDQWSLTVEGGAYFQDRGRDRLQILDQETGETFTLLEDLDSVSNDAVGANQTRSFHPVAHLVIRRRF
jgi:hypothetical protein